MLTGNIQLIFTWMQRHPSMQTLSTPSYAPTPWKLHPSLTGLLLRA